MKLQIISDEKCQQHGLTQPLPGQICAAQPNGEGFTSADVCGVSLVMRIFQYLAKQQFSYCSTFSLLLKNFFRELYIMEWNSS